MILRRPASLLLVLLTLPLALSLPGCNKVESIEILPASGFAVLTAIGQTVQFKAIASEEFGSANPTTADITTSVTWSVSNPSVATINASGVATAVSTGYTEITAEQNGIVATSDLLVDTQVSGTGTPSLAVIPGSATETFVGETTQFTASGSLTGVGSLQNLTSQVQWVSSNIQVATVNSTGLATAVGAGTTTITAESGGLNASAPLTVAVSVASATPTLTIIPSADATATFVGETTQFIALGNLTGSTATQNLTNNVTWYSSDVSIATINQAGLATAVAANLGTSPSVTTITAIGTTNTGSLLTATSTLSVEPAGGTVNLPQLAVYMSGTGTGTVSSSPGTIACGSSAAGASCTGSFSLNTTVTLTAAPASGSIFGGWSANCTVGGNPLQCTVKMTNNETVGAVFNP